MDKEEERDKKNAIESFGDIFRAFGDAVGEIFNDPELKEKGREFGKSFVASANAMGDRIKDEDVKIKFKDVGKAAQNFGEKVADTFREKKDEDNDSK